VKALDFFTNLHGREGTISRAALGGVIKEILHPSMFLICYIMQRCLNGKYGAFMK
jgi:hypothetical protein